MMRSVLMVFASLCGSLWLQAAEFAKIPILPAERWRVEAGAEDKVTLSAQGPCLVIDYDVNVRDWHQIGHQSLKQASIKLLFKEPQPLTGDAARIVFEAWGHGQGGWQTQDRMTQFRPLIQDASGEKLSYTSYPYPHLKNAAVTWGRWMSNSFRAAEAGGATQDVYEASGGDGNAWPDGQLSFSGFEITVRKPEFGRAQGRLAVGEIAVAPTRLPYEAPYAYADSLLPKPGTYRFAASIATGFQELPRTEFDHQITLAPGDLESARQKIAFPLGPDGEYWISYQVTDATGKPVIGDTMRTRVIGNPDPKPLGRVDAAQPPVLGNLRINWASHAGGIYRRDEPLAVAVRVYPKDQAGPLTLNWQLRQSRYDAVSEKGTIEVPAGDKAFQGITLTPKGEANRDAYRLTLTLDAGGQTIDTATYEFGRPTDFTQPRTTRTGMILDRDYVKKGAYFRLSYLQLSDKKFASEDEALADFEKQADEITKLTRYITYMIDLRDTEVLPGVFDFALLDRIMDAAADRGAALTIRLAHVDQYGEYTWQPYFRQYNYDGTPIFMHFYGGFSVVDDNYTTLWHRAYRALYDRYKVHPGFQGYYLLEPAGESTVADKPWEGVVCGYEPPMAAAFARWLRENGGFSLDQLNQRWGTTLKSFDDVTVPLPDFASGAMPDLRLPWVDFCRFKHWLDHDGWFPVAANRIREYDPNHVVIIYGPPDTCPGPVDYGHNGGNHFLENEGRYVDAWEKFRTGWITEPHHPHRWAAYGDPAEKSWVLDWSVWVMTAQAGGGGANLHAYYDPRPGRLAAHFGTDFAFDRIEKYRPICEELQTLHLVNNPFRVAVLQDPYTLFTKHRTVFMPRADDLKRWFELLKFDSVRFQKLVPENLADYRLILPNVLDEVMSDANLKLLDQAVRENGAKVIMTANTGRYCPERGKEPYQLLRQFGIKPPTGDYVQTKENVTAKASADNPLFAKDSTVPFFCLADLKRDLQSKEIRDKFWAYPFRWIPQTDYFGYYPGQQPGGDVWANFADGGAAVTRHQVGKGEVVVFWGIPDYRPEKLGGMMAKAATWAGVTEAAQGAPIPRMLEGSSKELGRNYVLLYHETPGTYKQPFPSTPDGNWFVEEIVGDRKLGTWTAQELRTGQLPTTFGEGNSPLQILRLTPAKAMRTKWVDKFRVPEKAASAEKK